MKTIVFFNSGQEYEGTGFTQREAKNEAARSLLKVIPNGILSLNLNNSF